MARNIVPWAPRLAQVSSKAKYRGTRVVPNTSRLGLIVWVGLLVIFAVSLVLGDSGLLRARNLESQLAHATQERAGLQKDFDRLTRELSIQANDPRSYEKPAREKYRMVKEGERLYLFEDDGLIPAGPWDEAFDATDTPDSP